MNEKDYIVKICAMLLSERRHHEESYYHYVELTKHIKFLQDFAETLNFEDGSIIVEGKLNNESE